MDTLPAATLTRICGHLKMEDTSNFRLVNRACSQAALEVLFNSITIYMTGQSYIHLLKIARRPDLAKNVHSMIYKAHMLPTEFMFPTRWIVDAANIPYVSRPTSLAGWNRAYRNYLDMTSYQSWIILDSVDFWMLHDAMVVLKGLKKITVSAGIYCGGYIPFDRTHSKVDHYLKPTGVRHVNAVLCTAAAANTPLQKLRVDGVHWKFFMQHEPGLKLMMEACKNLTSIHVHLLQGDELQHRVLHHCRPECYQYLRKSGALRECFAAMPELKTLKLTFDGVIEKDWHHPVRLQDIIGDNFIWPKLQKLELNRFTTDEDRFLNLLGNHKDTLKCLRLENVTLKSGGSWLHILTHIQENLRLTSARITGWLITGHNVSEIDEEETWDLHGGLGNEVKEYLLRGGSCPLSP